HPTTHLPLPLLDLTNQPKTQQEQSFRALASEPFDLSRTPLLRAALVKLGSDEYVFLVTVHHVVADGWSVGVLIRELGVCYSALGGGVEPDLPVLSVQYADYSLWLREWLDGGRSRASLAWWVERLAGVVPLELPTDRPRPLVQRYRGAQWVGEVSGELFAAVEGCAAGVRATPFMVLLAAFDALLARWCGQDDIVVGTPVAGRLRPEVEGLIGFFANSLVLRADCGGDPSFGELVGRVREVCLAAYAHQEVPFERIVEQLHPVRDLTRTPVFQVMFALQNAPAAVLEFPGLRLEPFDVDTGAAKFDLSMMLTPRAGGGLAVTVEYNTDLFDPETVDWLAGAWQRLLAAGVAAPSTRLSGLPLLDERQEARLVEWGRGPVIESDGLTVVDLVGRQAARTPDALAVDGCTYRELEQRASGWALRLRGLGVGAGARVGVCVPRDADLVVALLAVLKTGAAYVPLDPAYPAARIGFMLEDSGAMCVLTTTAFASLVPDDLPRVLMDTPPGETGPVGRVRDDQLAYVIYTSGSTGVPKGVEVEHRALRSFLASMADTTGIGPGDVFAAVTTVSFDIAGLELFLPLTVGAQVVVVPRESTMDGAELSAVIGRHGVTMMQATPAVWQVLLDTQPELPDGFTALCGGDVLTQELAERMPARLVNLYGPTETTIWSTADPGGTSLGRPIANTTVAVVDGHGRPVPVGARGELVIGGRGVARGYLGRPALTAQRFRPDPSASGTRVYHTGDQVRWRPDGTLAFLGR
ncbi:MAG: amino acid adenylation domain-containing protein, partial [Mycobacterium sp.]|nr:amino acid adenylation domain-containing protein [Mycobacterium sp.]